MFKLITKITESSLKRNANILPWGYPSAQMICLNFGLMVLDNQ
jgi:hypothetical protein